MVGRSVVVVVIDEGGSDDDDNSNQSKPQLLQPPKNLFWAGTEFATQYCGYMEGAIYSGENAAKQVLSYLGR